MREETPKGGKKVWSTRSMRRTVLNATEKEEEEGNSGDEGGGGNQGRGGGG